MVNLIALPIGLGMAVQQAVDEVSAAAENALCEIEKRPITQQILLGAASGL